MSLKLDWYQIYPVNIRENLYTILCLFEDGLVMNFNVNFTNDEYLFAKHDKKMDKVVRHIIDKHIKNLERGETH